MKRKKNPAEKQFHRFFCIRRYSAIFLAVIFLLTAVGCKPSPALRDYVYDNRTEHIHPSETKELENDQDNTDPDEIIPPERFDQTGSERNRERQDPILSDKDHPQTVEGSAPEREYSHSTGKELTGNRTQDSTGAEQSGAQASEGMNSGLMIESSRGGSSGSGSGNSDVTLPSEEDTPREIVDESGTEAEIPIQADSLAAVGNAAVLVEMLGGGSKLRYSSESMKEGLASNIFDTSATEILWQGKGLAPLSEADFNRLLDSAPAVCLEVSGQSTFTDDQIQRLQNAGTEYVVLPEITSLTSAWQAVEVTAGVIGGSEAKKKSEAFQRYCSRIDSLVSGKTAAYSPDGINYEDGSSSYSLSETNGVLALYITAWDSTAHYLLHNEKPALEGNGAAVIQTGYLRHPVTAFLSKAGVANTSAMSENNYSLSSDGIKIRYVNPINNSLYNLEISGGMTGAKYTKEYVYTSTSLGNLGENSFLNVIVPEESVRQAIRADHLWEIHPYQMASGGHSGGYGFIDSDGRLVETTIHGNYEISVMPQGVGDWNSGSIESVMIPVWALWKIRGMIYRSEVVDCLKDFYQEFYNYSLSEAEIQQILVD